MLIAYVVSHREIGPANALAQWVVEMGGVKSHDCLICVNKPAARFGVGEKLLPILEKAFHSVSIFEPFDEVEVPWPNAKSDARSPNHMFKRVSMEIEYNQKQPWLWMEMDAVPVKASWLDEIEAEYDRAAKPFMGVKLFAGPVGYMSGVAVYPANITRCTALLRNCAPNQDGGMIPFDVYGGRDTTRMMHETQLIQYVKPNPNGVADWSVSHDEILPKTVLFHRSKDLGLIEFLRGTGVDGLAATAFPEVEVTNERAGVIGKSHLTLKGTPDFKEMTMLTLIPTEGTMDFESLSRYHVHALEGLASSAERRSDIVNLLQNVGLTSTVNQSLAKIGQELRVERYLAAGVAKSLQSAEDTNHKFGLPTPSDLLTPKPKKRGKQAKRRPGWKPSPEHLEKLKLNLERARAKKHALALEEV